MNFILTLTGFLIFSSQAEILANSPASGQPSIRKCSVILRKLQDDPVFQTIKMLTSDPHHSITAEELAFLQKHGVLDQHGRMYGDFEREVLSQVFDNRLPPPKPDRMARDLTQKENQLNMAPGGKGYTFFSVEDLISRELLDALRTLPDPRVVDAASVTLDPGEVRFRNDIGTFMPVKLRGRPSERNQWEREANNNVAIVAREILVLAHSSVQRALSFLDPEEASQLEVGQIFIRSTESAEGLDRHSDKMYLRIGVGIINLPTLIYSTEKREVVGAPEKWAVMFSGRERPSVEATQHYGPVNRDGGVRHALFIDLVRKEL